MRHVLVLVLVLTLMGTACKGGTNNNIGTVNPATTTWARHVPATTPFAQFMRDSIPQKEWETQRDVFTVMIDSFASANEMYWLYGLDTFVRDFRYRVLNKTTGPNGGYDSMLSEWETYQGLSKDGYILKPWHMEQLVLDADVMETYYDDQYRRNGVSSGFDYYPEPNEVARASVQGPIAYSATYAYPMTRVIADVYADIPKSHRDAVGLHTIDMDQGDWASATYNWDYPSPRDGKMVRGVVLYSPYLAYDLNNRTTYTPYVVTHETGHGVDHQVLPSPNPGNPFDYDIDDPSNAFYQISWTDSRTLRRSDDVGFVSYYAMTNPVEDFAESYANFKEDPVTFHKWIYVDWGILSAMTDAEKVATPLFRKYALFYVLFGKEYGTPDVEISRLLKMFPLPKWVPPLPDGTMATSSAKKVPSMTTPVCSLKKRMPRK